MTIGQRVFFIDVNPYDEILYSGILTSEVHQYNNKYFHTIVDVRNESFNQVCYGHRHAYEEDCFNTIEELKAELVNRYNQKVNLYCDEIKTIEDLVKFALQHTLFGEDTELEAIDAYKKSAKNLLNIEV